MENKPAYSDDEVDELCDIYYNHGKTANFYEVENFLKEKFGWSDVHNVITELRKEFINKRFREMQEKLQKNHKSSTLDQKLSDRLNFHNKQQEDGK